MSDVETTFQLERAQASREKLPTELSFEEVIKNRTLPPCSLNDFMDYLYYVEHNAESLQFFLWYYDYIHRWSSLLPRQKALSPIWDPEKASEPVSKFIKYSHKRETSDKMRKIISIMEMDHQRSAIDEMIGGQDGDSTPLGTYSRPRTSTSSSSASIMSPVDVKEDWQPFTIQPLRDEVTRIARHYIADSAPRQLGLTPQDRETCLRATSHTSHPSALLPAFVVAEAHLKGRSHPNFIAWSLSNASRHRVIFLYCLGGTLVTLGLVLDVFLVLSRLNHFLRITCLVLWWPGITILIAASSGVCLVLHFQNARHLRPWERDEWTDDGAGQGDWFKRHSRKDTSSTVSSRGSDPLRKPSLQTFGPRNNPEGEGWNKSYTARSLAGKVFEDVVPVQSQALQLAQDKVVLMAVAWGGLVASVVVVSSLVVPSGNLFW